ARFVHHGATAGHRLGHGRQGPRALAGGRTALPGGHGPHGGRRKDHLHERRPRGGLTVTSRAAAAGSVGVPIAARGGAMLMPFLTPGAAGGAATPLPGPVLCGGGGTAQTIAGTRLDAEQLGNAHTIITVTANRHLPVYAAIVAVTTAYTESTLHNTTTHTDHDSEGLFQQRISIYTKPIADDPVKATNAFLHRLVPPPHRQTTPP